MYFCLNTVCLTILCPNWEVQSDRIFHERSMKEGHKHFLGFKSNIISQLRSLEWRQSSPRLSEYWKVHLRLSEAQSADSLPLSRLSNDVNANCPFRYSFTLLIKYFLFLLIQQTGKDTKTYYAWLSRQWGQLHPDFKFTIHKLWECRLKGAEYKNRQDTS